MSQTAGKRIANRAGTWRNAGMPWTEEDAPREDDFVEPAVASEARRLRKSHRRPVLSVLAISVALIAAMGFALNNSFMDAVLGAIVAVVTIIIYFVPTIVAATNRQRNVSAILILNLFLGWTFLGWVIALVWACTKPARSG